MNLPFVSKARFDLLQHNFDEARKLHHEQMAEEKARYAKDIDFYRAALALKDARIAALTDKAIAGPAGERPAMVVPTRKPADEAIDQMVDRFGGSSRLRRQLQRYVTRERSCEGADENKIADAVLNWRDRDGDEDVA